jgi:hypothetical protein
MNVSLINTEGDLTISGSIIAPDMSLSGDLDLSGNATISGNLDVSGNITVDGNSIFRSNVGIGTTADSSYNLDVNGNARFTKFTNSYQGSPITNAQLIISRDANGSYASDSGQLIITGSTDNRYRLGLMVDTVSDPIVTKIQGGFAGTSTLPLCLNSAGGNVGIGTDNPQYTLHVSGDLSVSGNTSINGILSLNGSDGDKGNVPATQTISNNTLIPSFEVLYYHLTGNANKIAAKMTLQNNIYGTTNYTVLPSVYYGYTGSSGTYGPRGTSGSITEPVIYGITSTDFRFVFQKDTNDNVNIYIIFLIIYQIKNTDFPKVYS